MASQKHLSEAGARVILITFGTNDGANRWLKDTQCPYLMLGDGERKLYKYFGLFPSISKTWDTVAMTYYAEQVHSGRELLSSYGKDDPHQMGGDFIISKNGKLIFLHPSQSSTDRPSVEALLHAIQ